MNTQRPSLLWLIIGDVLAVLIVTMLGFVTHYGEVMLSGRWLASFIPVLAAWFAVAPLLGVYDRKLALQNNQLWRPLAAAVISAPLAATFRALILNSVIAPVFILVLMATNGLGLLIWRWVWARLSSRTAVYG